MSRVLGPVPASALAAFLLAAMVLACPAALALDGPFGFMPWSPIYDSARDERSLAGITRDKVLSARIKAALLDRNADLGLAVKVYCLRGRVTLLGQLDDRGFQRFAVAQARRTKGVRTVVAHWVPRGRENTTASDLAIAAKIRMALVADSGISATQVEQEVFGGHVFLIGLVGTQEEADKVVEHARAVSGVTGVTSLLVPSRK